MQRRSVCVISPTERLTKFPLRSCVSWCISFIYYLNSASMESEASISVDLLPGICKQWRQIISLMDFPLCTQIQITGTKERHTGWTAPGHPVESPAGLVTAPSSMKAALSCPSDCICLVEHTKSFPNWWSSAVWTASPILSQWQCWLS